MAPRGRPPGKRSSLSRPSTNPTSDNPSSPSASTNLAKAQTQPSPPNPAAITSSTPSTARTPVQRLDTLRKPVAATATPTASSSSSIPEAGTSGGSSQAKKPLRAKPRFTARRSKEERDAIAAVELERAKERSAAADAAARLAGAAGAAGASRGSNRERDRGRAGRGGRGRGGYMGMGLGAGMGAGMFSSGMSVSGGNNYARDNFISCLAG